MTVFQRNASVLLSRCVSTSARATAARIPSNVPKGGMGNGRRNSHNTMRNRWKSCTTGHSTFQLQANNNSSSSLTIARIVTNQNSNYSSAFHRHFASSAATESEMEADVDDDVEFKDQTHVHAHAHKIIGTIDGRKNSETAAQIQRLSRLRNVGILAHVDAGKTTVTERMLALAGVVRSAGCVDQGNTVTDYLPAERERGITIQSAAISFDWGWHHNDIKNSNFMGQDKTDDAALFNDYEQNDRVRVQLIDTPGHVDFSVEVNRSVAVLDGAVLVLDAVAGVQAQTETVWKAITRPSWNNHRHGSTTTTTGNSSTNAGATSTIDLKQNLRQDHQHEPLPCLAMINKMDKDGSNFGKALQSIRDKLPNANPIAIQLPLFRKSQQGIAGVGAATTRQQIRLGENDPLPSDIFAVSPDDDTTSHNGEFVGAVDLIHMRAVIWPSFSTASSLSSDGGTSGSNAAFNVADVEHCIPSVVNLLQPNSHTSPLHEGCTVTQDALQARTHLIEDLANIDATMEEVYLNDELDDISNSDLRVALRRVTLAHKAIPVMAGAALKGKGIEPLLDAVADLLPSPLDRIPPPLNRLYDDEEESSSITTTTTSVPASTTATTTTTTNSVPSTSTIPAEPKPLGHPLNPSLLALAFKVVHMKGRGGSGDGRVVFARVYSGTLRDRQKIQVISPPAPGEAPEPNDTREERVGGMLELAGGRFDNMEDGVCHSGDVCAIVGLKSVVTGDTILMSSSDTSNNSNNNNNNSKKKKNSRRRSDIVCLAGVESPKPVITVRLEAETSSEQTQLSHALQLMSTEDPSLVVEETESSTLLSGLGELHIEVTLDRIFREYGLRIMVGPPSVTYRETVKDMIETPGGDLLEYDHTIGGTRLQGAVHLKIFPLGVNMDKDMDMNMKDEDKDMASSSSSSSSSSSCVLLSDPIVTVGSKARSFLGLHLELGEDELLQKSDLARALIRGCQGALKRGALKNVAMANVVCHIENVDAEGGLPALKALPGALQAASANAVAMTLKEGKENHKCTVLEPTMSLEIVLPNEMVGGVLSDLSSRRGTVSDVIAGDNNGSTGAGAVNAKSLMRGDVPLIEILGYATRLRSLTGGEGSFTAEYKGHSPCGTEIEK